MLAHHPKIAKELWEEPHHFVIGSGQESPAPMKNDDNTRVYMWLGFSLICIYFVFAIVT
jgi:hypothetical protein